MPRSRTPRQTRPRGPLPVEGDPQEAASAAAHVPQRNARNTAPHASPAPLPRQHLLSNLGGCTYHMQTTCAYDTPIHVNRKGGIGRRGRKSEGTCRTCGWRRRRWWGDDKRPPSAGPPRRIGHADRAGAGEGGAEPAGLDHAASPDRASQFRLAERQRRARVKLRTAGTPPGRLTR